MAIEVALDESRPLFTVTCSGMLGFVDFLEALPKVQAHESYQSDIPILWDMTGAQFKKEELGSSKKTVGSH